MKIEKSKVAPVSLFLKVVLTLISVMILAVTMFGAVSVLDKRLAITVTGTVTDSVCGSDHGTKSVANAECTRTCVELGAQYALAVGKKLYILQGHQIDLERFAGNEVRIKGHTSSRDTVIVDQVDRLYTEAMTAPK
jgi:hypothetical protein